MNDLTFNGHIDFRSQQYENQKDSFGMRTMEINPTELCNRKCSFCPRGDWYPNKNLHLTIENHLKSYTIYLRVLNYLSEKKTYRLKNYLETTLIQTRGA